MKGTRLPGTPEPKHSWTGFGRVQLAGDSWGDPSGPLVLLLHGVGQKTSRNRAARMDKIDTLVEPSVGGRVGTAMQASVAKSK